MTMTLREELRQTKPFTSLEQEAFLSIIRTSVRLQDSFELMLKPYGVTATQYNVLRILRGAGEKGLCRNEVRERLVSRMPDVTRLLDRMEEAGWVARDRNTEDRRLVSTRLTKAGRELVDSLDKPDEEDSRRRLGHLSESQLRTLVELLALARSSW
ncbi:MAG: MarR family transcriptional regulator [Gemmatimonadaceae bacterium]